MEKEEKDFKIKGICPCKKEKCERHGKCGECVDFHKTSIYKPYCMRKKAQKGK
ncbi:hypothetical protein [Scatolibacter rhodanostii]|uniref:hypothetical protein n=1 Tax=Scatolibacter rhodanostii TaxID=2014781 RepID=UPI00190EBBE4|nr:hypothetical protein [Scatolibacter rhodanostii]